MRTTNYKGVIGDTPHGGFRSIHTNGTTPDCHNTIGCNGLFYRNRYRERMLLRDILDGTSNTFMVGEDVPQQNNHSAWAFSNGDYASCHAPLNYFTYNGLPPTHLGRPMATEDFLPQPASRRGTVLPCRRLREVRPANDFASVVPALEHAEGGRSYSPAP